MTDPAEAIAKGLLGIYALVAMGYAVYTQMQIFRKHGIFISLKALLGNKEARQDKTRMITVCFTCWVFPAYVFGKGLLWLFRNSSEILVRFGRHVWSVFMRLRIYVADISHRRSVDARQRAAQVVHDDSQLRDTMVSLTSFAELLGHSPDEDRQSLVRILEIVSVLEGIAPQGTIRAKIRPDLNLVIEKMEKVGYTDSISYKKICQFVGDLK